MTKTETMPAAASGCEPDIVRRTRGAGFLKVLGAMCLVTLVSGCVVGPDYRKPIVNMPLHWGNRKPQKVEKPAQLGEWWKRLNDPLLDALVDEAVAGNLDVATAKAKVREALGYAS